MPLSKRHLPKFATVHTLARGNVAASADAHRFGTLWDATHKGPAMLNRPTPFSISVAIIVCTTTVLTSSARTSLHADEQSRNDPTSAKESADALSILRERCWSCHGSEKHEAGLRLDQRDSILRGGDSGPALIEGEGTKSLLLQRIQSDNRDEQMPPKGERLSSSQIETITNWINHGARFPDSSTASTSHWAYQPITIRHPKFDHSQNPWRRNVIDDYVLDQLAATGVQPSPEAPGEILIRRLSLDLTGLLPEPEQVDAFLNDKSPNAWENLVDQLLASPHFGERWGRHWLDLARYADSDGYEKDNARPDAWHWRNWVIDSINSDMPFDQFTIEQLAGDLLPDATPTQKLATAFHRQTLTNTEGGTDQEQFRFEANFDRTETTASVWMAMTLGCARCHSHKYEAITQKEYFQLFSVFNNADETTSKLPANPADLEAWQKEHDAWQQRFDSLKSQPEKTGELKELRKKEPPKPEPTVRVLAERTKEPRTTWLLHRGDFLEPDQSVALTLKAPTILPAIVPRDPNARPDRLDLARWLVSPEHPLTARVAVNHIWSHLFGQGLVQTSADFGVRGENPTHPELLDWLAASFKGENPSADGIHPAWSRKALIRLIVTSATYRQSSSIRPELLSLDPLNHLLARQNRIRVDGEIVRDITLQASGLLSRKIGGPSVFPPLPAGIAELSYAGNFQWKTSQGEDRYRRGMYTFFKRTSPHPNLTTFDCPDANLTCIQRSVSNTPLQALVTLNNETFTEAARHFATTLSGSPDSPEAILQTTFRRCFCRLPSAKEESTLLALYNDTSAYFAVHPEEAKQLAAPQTAEASKSATTAEPDKTTQPMHEKAAWIIVCRILMNTDEFITRE